MFASTESLASDPRALSAYFEASHELLHTIADVLDVRRVFPRVSEIAKRMLPHDALTMSSQDEDLNIQLEATSSDDFDGAILDAGGMAMAPELVVGDLARERLPIAEWTVLRQRVEADGYRSLLRVTTQARDWRVGVAFWSKQAHAYDRRHLPLARRIVEHLALGVCHERLARTASAVRPERPRTSNLEGRARLVVDEVSSRTERRIVGASAEWRAVMTEATSVARTDTTVLMTGESGPAKKWSPASFMPPPPGTRDRSSR